MAQWIKHLSHNHDDLRLSPWNPHKPRCYKPSTPSVRWEEGSRESPKPASLASVSVNKRLGVKQGGRQGLKPKSHL